jgi:hypothetical protein
MPYIKFVHEDTGVDTTIFVEHKGHLATARAFLDTWDAVLPADPSAEAASGEGIPAGTDLPKAEADAAVQG